MTDLTRHSELVIRQQVEQFEIFTPFETANRYSVHTSDGAQLMYAYEESGNMSRQFAGTHRALSIHVVDGDSKPVLQASRDFFWVRSHLRVHVDGGHIGTLNRQFGFGRKFSLVDANEREITQITSGLFRPHTFIAKNARGGEIARPSRTRGARLRASPSVGAGSDARCSLTPTLSWCSSQTAARTRSFAC